MNIDSNIFFFFNNFAGRNKTLDLVIVFFAEYLAYILILLFFGYLIRSAYLNKEKIIAALSALLAGGIARYGIGSPIRFLWHRPRPFLTYHVHQLIAETSYSFPSGHSTFFFAFSTVAYLYNRKLGVFFYVATILMTLGRIAAGVHYPSDILAGAVIGILCGWLTFRYITPILRRMSNGYFR
jgi:undecaprenyl-diphosphatase